MFDEAECRATCDERELDGETRERRGEKGEDRDDGDAVPVPGRARKGDRGGDSTDACQNGPDLGDVVDHELLLRHDPGQGLRWSQVLAGLLPHLMLVVGHLWFEGALDETTPRTR